MKRVVEFSSVQPRFTGSPSWPGQDTTMHNNGTEERKTMPFLGLPQRSLVKTTWREGHCFRWVGREGKQFTLAQMVNLGMPQLR